MEVDFMKENKAKFTRLHSHELSFRASHVKSLKSFFKAHLKLSLVFIFSFSLLFPIFSESYSYSSNVESENKLFSQISVAYKNNFYIGTVSSADEFIEKFRDSVYLPEVLFYKAESLVNLENYSEAQKTLKDVLSLFKTGDAIFARGVFLLGKIKFAEKKYENALFYFSKIPSLLVGEAEGLKDIESQTILLTAQSLYFLKEYEKSIPYFELIISSGENYSLEEYMHSLSFLFLGYAECRKFNEMTKLFETFPEDYFDDDFYFQISLFVAQAYEELLEYKKAFALYSKILEGDRGTKAVIALKKAYLISEKYDVGIEQNVFFAEAIDNLQNAEEIVEEFYLRLGIDEFNSKNYQTAVSYFDSIKSDISESQNARVGNLYKAKILMEQNNYKEAFNILSSLQKIEDFDSDSVNATLLICNYNLKDDYSLYSQIPEIFAKIENPDYKSKYILSAFYSHFNSFQTLYAHDTILYIFISNSSSNVC